MRLANGNRLRLLPSLALLLLLVGCTGAPVATPSSALTSPASTPTPTPTPVATIVTIAADGFEVADQNDRPLATFDYRAAGGDTAAALTELFGFAPTVEIVEPKATDFGFQGTKYDWEGFALLWQYGYEVPPVADQSPTPYVFVYSSVASIRGIGVQGADGVRVGDGQGDLAAKYPDHISRYDSPDGTVIERALTSCVPVSIPPGDSPDGDRGEPMDCVLVLADPAEGPITGIQAPAKLNYGM